MKIRPIWVVSGSGGDVGELLFFRNFNPMRRRANFFRRVVSGSVWSGESPGRRKRSDCINSEEDMPKEPQKILAAANDNPGGGTTVSFPLSGFVSLMAKAYVNETRNQEAKSA